MFTHTKTGEERLAIWRNIRQNIANPTEIVDQLGDIKREQRYIDYYTPVSWPTPFEIVEQGLFCQSGITLVLTATLQYAGVINTDTVRLDVISNHITGTEGLVLIHDEHAYNFLPKEIVSADYAADNGTCYDSYRVSIKRFI